MNTKNASAFVRVLAIILFVLYALSLSGFLYGNYQDGISEVSFMIINGIILSIPLILLYGSIGVLAVAAYQKYRIGQITPKLAKLIYWSPRIAGIAIIFFVSLFALDVFEEGYTIGEMLIGFLMHMLPSFALIIGLVLAWRWEWIGFLGFIVIACFFMILILSNDPLGNLRTVLLFSAPMFVIALLFGVNWQWRKDLRQLPDPLSH